MKKNILMFTCSALTLFSVCKSVYALTPTEQLKAVKDVFVKSFEEMDTNQDGEVSKKEYLNHQFEKFRINIMEADSFDAELNDKLLEGVDISLLKQKNNTSNEKKSSNKEQVKQKADKKENKAKEEKETKDPISSSTDIMQEMANYTLDLDTPEDELSKAEIEINALLEEEGALGLTKEDVMPELNGEELPSLEKLDIKALDDDLDSLIQPEIDDKDKEINEMMSVIKKTLPKKIDEITSWVDIVYNNKVVTYVYKADVDTKSFSKEEKDMLASSIKNEACANAYETMCPKIKPMFIDVGIDMQIRYVDKENQELSSCEFNKTTCK